MNKLKVTDQLKTYLEWPLWLSVLWAGMVAALFVLGGIKIGLTGLLFLVIYVTISLIFYGARRPRITNELISFATQYGQVQKNLLKEFVLPYALLDAGGNFLWMNDEFSELCGKDTSYHKNAALLFSEIKASELPGSEERTECEVAIGDRTYRAAMQKVVFSEFMKKEELADDEEDDDNYLIALYMFDDTELNKLVVERDRDRLVCGLLSLDNYEEALESVEEVRRSLLLALIDRKISKYFTEVDGIVRKTEKDKYFFVIRKSALTELENTKFSLLDDVKTVNIGNEMSITISIGIGFGSDSFLQNAEAARVGIELALGRGGDQVVVKDGYNTRYFGGKTESMEKNTRVKARVKAHALKEILSSKNEIVIMGHKIADVDCLGAAVGIYRAARTIEKPAHIVIDNPPDALRPLIDVFLQSSEYSEQMFIGSKEALEMTNANTAVVVVDTNKPDYTECEELLHRTNAIIVLDHHRQSRDFIQNAVLSYIEPYASSASEMVAEVLQYFDDKLRIRNIEADSLYAGIMIDTNNFLTKTGVRTFEAAAYLRRNGADVTRIRKKFRDSMEDCRAKANAIAGAEIFRESFVIAEVRSEGLKSPTVVCAQTANELLTIVGIKASFAITDYNHMIYISARAIDEVNVQLIMERLGGGGHLNIAGAQLADSTVPAARELIKSTITQMKEEGDL